MIYSAVYVRNHHFYCRKMDLFWKKYHSISILFCYCGRNVTFYVTRMIEGWPYIISFLPVEHERGGTEGMAQRGQAQEGSRGEKVVAGGETRTSDVQVQYGAGGDSMGNYGPLTEKGYGGVTGALV